MLGTASCHGGAARLGCPHSVQQRVCCTWGAQTLEPLGSSLSGLCGLDSGACAILFGPLLPCRLHRCVGRCGSAYLGISLIGLGFSTAVGEVTEGTYSSVRNKCFCLMLLSSWVLSWQDTCGGCKLLPNPIRRGRLIKARCSQAAVLPDTWTMAWVCDWHLAHCLYHCPEAS